MPKRESSAVLTGVARVRITPPLGTPMGGYISRTHGCTGVIEDLWLKALYLADAQGHVFVIVSADVVFIPLSVTRRVRQRLVRSMGGKKLTLLLNATHTHCGPNTSPDLLTADADRIDGYLDFLAGAAVTAAREARDRAQSATLRYRTCRAELAMNRRVIESGRCHFAPNPDGPTDPVVRIWSLHRSRQRGGAPVVVWFSYSCHPTTHAGYQISPDWPGFACLAIEAALPGTTAIFTQGACGELRPPWKSGRIGTPAQARRIAQNLTGNVLTALKRGRVIRRPLFRSVRRTIRLPLANWPTETQLRRFCAERLDENWCQHNMPHWLFLLDEPGDPNQNLQLRRLWVTRMRRTRRTSLWGKPLTLEATLVELSPGHELLALAGEVCFDLAQQIRRRLNRSRLTVLGYTNDGPAYIPSEKILHEGGYEGGESMFYFSHPAPFKRGVEDRLVKGVADMFTRLE